MSNKIIYEKNFEICITDETKYAQMVNSFADKIKIGIDEYYIILLYKQKGLIIIYIILIKIIIANANILNKCFFN